MELTQEAKNKLASRIMQMEADGVPEDSIRAYVAEFKRRREPAPRQERYYGQQDQDYVPLTNFAKQGGFTVTGSNEKTGHNPGSKHYVGGAIDVRTKDKTPEQISAFIKAAQAAGIKVVDERKHPKGQAVWTGEHLHLEAADRKALDAFLQGQQKPKQEVPTKFLQDIGVAPKPAPKPAEKPPTTIKGIIQKQDAQTKQVREAEAQKRKESERLGQAYKLQEIVENQIGNPNITGLEGIPLPNQGRQQIGAEEGLRGASRGLGKIVLSPEIATNPALTSNLSREEKDALFQAVGEAAPIAFGTAATSGVGSIGDVIAQTALAAALGATEADIAGNIVAPPLLKGLGKYISKVFAFGPEEAAKLAGAINSLDRTTVNPDVLERTINKWAQDTPGVQWRENAPIKEKPQGPTESVLGQERPELELSQAGKGTGKIGLKETEEEALSNLDNARQRLLDADPKSPEFNERLKEYNKLNDDFAAKYGEKAPKEVVPEAQKAPEEVIPQPKPAPKPKAAVRGAQVPKTRPVAAANRSMAQVREAINLDPIEKATKETVDQWEKEAIANDYHKPEVAHRIAREVIENGKSLSKSEQMGMAAAVSDLETKWNALSESVAKNPSEKTIKAISEIDQQIADISLATNKHGTEWGRQGVARQALMNRDGTFAGWLSKIQRDVNRPLTPEEIGFARKASEFTKAATENVTRAQSQVIKRLADEGLAKTRRVKIQDAQAKAVIVRQRIKNKWAQSSVKPPSSKQTGRFIFAELTAERIEKLIDIAPDIKELSKLYLSMGKLKLEDNLSAVVKHLREDGIDDIDENDIANILAGKVPAGGTKAVTDWTKLREEASRIFSDAKKAHADDVAFNKKRHVDIQKAIKEEHSLLRKAKDASAKIDIQKRLVKLNMERGKIEANLKALGEEGVAVARKEKEFWADVRKKQQAWEKGKAQEKSADTKAIREQLAERDKAYAESGAGQIEAAQKRLDKLVKRREALLKGGTEPGRKPRPEATKAIDEEIKQVQTQIRNIKNQPKMPDRAKQLLDRAARIQEKLDTLESEGIIPGMKSKRKFKVDPEVEKARVQEAAVRMRLENERYRIKAEAEKAMLANWDKALKLPSSFWNETRSLVASMDVSAPVNQGMTAAFTDFVPWLKSWVNSFKGLGIEPFETSKGSKLFPQLEGFQPFPGFKGINVGGLEKLRAQMMADPEKFNRAVAANLFEGKREIEDVFGISSTLPGVKHSQQMFEAAMEPLRWDMFNNWVGIAEKGGKPLTLEDLRVISDAVKTLTGQGKWASNTKISKMFFALRYRASQFESLLLAPLVRSITHGIKSGQWGPFKVILWKYAEMYSAMGLTVVAFNYAQEMKGPKDSEGKPVFRVETNPRSVNWGSLVYTNPSGTQQTIQVLPSFTKAFGLLAKLFQGRVNKEGIESKPKPFEEFGKYIASGAHPVVNTAIGLGSAWQEPSGKYYGEDFSVPSGWDNIAKSFAPISLQNIFEAMDAKKNDQLSDGEMIAAMALSAIGAGVKMRENYGIDLFPPLSKEGKELLKLGLNVDFTERQRKETTEAVGEGKNQRLVKKQGEFNLPEWTPENKKLYTNLMKEAIKAVVNDPDYDQWTLDERRKELESVIRKAKDTYKETVK